MSVTNTIVLGSSLSPESIPLTGTGFAFITLLSAGPNGEVVMYNLTTGAQTTINVNPAGSGGAGDVVFFNGKLYFRESGRGLSLGRIT